MAVISEPKRRGRAYAYTGVASHEIDWKHPNDKDIINFVESQVRYHDERHYSWVRRAKVQLAWAQGDQLRVWDDNRRGLVASFESENSRIALFINRIKPAILNWISLVTARPLSFRVHPATSDDQDIASARVQDRLVRYYWRKLFGDDEFIDALWIMFCTGCVFLKTTWDPLLGGQYDVKPDDLLGSVEDDSEPDTIPLREKFRKKIGGLLGVDTGDVELDADDGFRVGKGDLSLQYSTGFDVVPPYRTTNLKDAPWIITRNYQHIEDLRRRYGKQKTEGLNPSIQESYFGYQDYEGFEFSEDYYGYGQRLPNHGHDHVLVYELWRPKREASNDKGFHTVLAQQVVLKSGPHPYDHGEIPLVMLQELPSPKKFWPPSTVQDLMGPQAEINTSRTQVAAHKMATVEPRIIAERGAGLDEMAFTQPNEIVEVNVGKIDAVRPWVPEPLPSYLPYWEQSLRRDFEDVARNHAPSYGKQTGSVKSGKHAQALQEADSRLNAPMMRLLRDRLGHVCRQMLSLLKQFTDEERVLTVIGENNEPEVIEYSRETFPQAEFNVVCDLGQAMDRQTTLELIDMLSDRGWINPQSGLDKGMVMRWLDQGVTQEVDESAPDRANANLENMAMLRGTTLPNVSEGDDDTIHLLEHAREQKSPRYRRAIASDPKIELIFNSHNRHHEMKRIRKQLRQKVMAIEIEGELMMQAGLVPPQEQQQAEAQQGGQSRPPSGFAARPSGLMVPRQ